MKEGISFPRFVLPRQELFSVRRKSEIQEICLALSKRTPNVLVCRMNANTSHKDLAGSIHRSKPHRSLVLDIGRRYSHGLSLSINGPGWRQAIVREAPTNCFFLVEWTDSNAHVGLHALCKRATLKHGGGAVRPKVTGTMNFQESRAAAVFPVFIDRL